ncbi:Uncharacterised protein [Mycobacteroides abscessus subsp. abscessus]|uniref:hypothetical protein n=1 Tax=Mycobacteroides abscessus TaxID=36809 RepID=UPI000925C672|nr:hypothetical protein [Mycobacteroides abscessus]SIC64513.1 Uncharacterised protein [Mycobacteroides abscessus subsp. abscessus]SIG65524.1 Uncharacterised protein [Mycobacteroides abscessus subsp. abscessus]
MTTRLQQFEQALAELDKAVTDHSDAVERVHTTRTARTKAIRKAQRVGVTPGVIAQHIGLTSQRVSQLTVGRDASK